MLADLRHPRSLAAVLLVLPVLCAAAVPASAQPNPNVTGVTVSPAQPTWQDRVEVRVVGTSTCQVNAPFAASTTPGEPTVITVELELACNVDPAIHRPFEVIFDLGHLAPGDHRIDVVSGDTVAASRELTVYDVAPVRLEIGEGPFTDEDEIPVRAIALAHCPFVDVEGHLPQGIIDLVIGEQSNCGFVGQGPLELHDLSVELGPLPPGDYTVRVVERLDPASPDGLLTVPLTVYDADGCVPSETVLCLQGGRFRVEADWADFEGGSGEGVAVPLPGRDDTGAFWFFDDDNLELTVKVLDGCGVNGHHWVFVSSGSTVEYEITVTDTEADVAPRVYRNDLGQMPDLIPDTGAFPTCA